MGMSKSLTDEQWCILDLLMRARDKGAPLSRLELLTNKWALLTMPEAFVTWDGPHNVTITDVGSAVYRLRFGRRTLPQLTTPET